jgi:hypothetical protein
LQEEIEVQLAKITADILPQLKDLKIEEIYIRSGFVHRWHIEAHVSGKTKEDLSVQAVYPNPKST